MAKRPVATRDLLGSFRGSQCTCSPCRQEGSVSEASSFCETCMEYLCRSCLTAHKRGVATKDHRMQQDGGPEESRRCVVSPTEVDYCNQHKNRAVEFFCAVHDEVFCMLCSAVFHGRCHDVKKIADVSSSLLASEDVDSHVKRSKRFVKKLRDVRDERKKDLISIQDQKEACIEDLNDVRRKIAKTFETPLFQTLEDSVEKEKIAVKSHVTRLESAIAALEADVSILETAGSRGDDVKSFIAMKRVSSAEKMQSILNDINEETYQVDIKFVQDKVLTDILAKSQTLGRIEVIKSRNVRDELLPEQASLAVEMKDRQLLKIGETYVGELDDTFVCRIRSLLFLPNNKLLMTDYWNDKIRLTDIHLKPASSIRIKDPWDIALVSAEEAIVTTQPANRLIFLRLEPNLQVTGECSINVQRRCYGVAVCKDKVLVACHDNPGQGAVLVMDLQGREQRWLGINADGTYMFNRPFYIAVNSTGDRVYVSDSDAHVRTVTCLTMDGTVVFAYNGVHNPGALLVDENDHIFVCDRVLHSVQVITKEGHQYRTLLTTRDGLSEPWTAAYRRSDNTLVVGSFTSNVIQIYRAS